MNATVLKEEIVRMPLSKLVPIENCRFDVKATDSAPGGPTWEDFVESFRSTGDINVDAVKVRAIDGGKFEQITGARRRAAIEQIAAEKGIKDPEIRVVVEKMSKAEAVIENARENLGRSGSMRPQDIAYGLLRASKAAKEEGKALTNVELAKKMGISQQNAGLLLSIAVGAEASVFKRWREVMPALSVHDMKEISEITPKKDQVTEYDKRIAELAAEPRGAKGAKKKLEKQIESLGEYAEKVGKCLGRLVYTERLEIKDHEGVRDTFISVPEDFDSKTKKSILKKFEVAYMSASMGPDEGEEEKEEETEA